MFFSRQHEAHPAEQVTHLVGIRVVNLVESDDGGKLFVDKGVDDCFDCLVRPLFQRLPHVHPVQEARDDGRVASVP